MLQKFKGAKEKVVYFYTKRSTLAFFVTLGILLALIVLSHFLRTPEPEPTKPERETKKTAVYSASSPLYLQAITEVKSEGVTNIVALTPGIITSIAVKPGSAVQNGTTLLSLTNDYNSGATGLSTQIAKNNLALNQELERLDQKIREDQDKSVRYSDILTDREETVTLQNLKKDRETQEINLLNAELNYRLASVSDAVLRPRALNAGFVQSIPVKKGDYVTPGQTLVTLSNSAGSTIIEASVTSEVAPFIDITKESKITLTDGTSVMAIPNYFSSSEDQEGMFTIQFIVDTETAKRISFNENPKVELPLRFAQDTTILAPLDAVFKNSNSATVLVAVNGKAESKNVTLGRVRGNYIEVLSGIESSDQIILNRFVLAGDSVEIITE